MADERGTSHKRNSDLDLLWSMEVPSHPMQNQNVNVNVLKLKYM